MRTAVLAIVMVLGLLAAGQSRAQGFLSNIMSELGLRTDTAKELDVFNSVARPTSGYSYGYSGSPGSDPISGAASEGPTHLRIPGAPGLVPIAVGSSQCKTDLGVCSVNVLASAGQACWCPTMEGYASGKVVRP